VTRTGVLERSMYTVLLFVSCFHFDVPKYNYELCRVSVEAEEYTPEMCVVSERKLGKIGGGGIKDDWKN
jgi:hypothetical protein